MGSNPKSETTSLISIWDDLPLFRETQLSRYLFTRSTTRSRHSSDSLTHISTPSRVLLHEVGMDDFSGRQDALEDGNSNIEGDGNSNHNTSETLLYDFFKTGNNVSSITSYALSVNYSPCFWTQEKWCKCEYKQLCKLVNSSIATTVEGTKKKKMSSDGRSQPLILILIKSWKT